MTNRTFIDLKSKSLSPHERDIVDSTHMEVISVRSKGASGAGGTSNDRAEIQQAIKAAGELLNPARGAIYFPRGSYIIDRPLEIDGLNNISFFSFGKSARIKMADNANLDEMILVTDCDFFEIHGLRIDGNKANQTSGNQHAIRIEESARVVVRDLYIADAAGTAIRLNGAASDQMFGTILSNNRMRDCGSGLHLVTNVLDSQISNLWVGQSSGIGIQIDAGCSSNFLSNVHSWGNTGDAIQIRSNQNRIVNGYFENSGVGMDMFSSDRNMITNTWISSNSSQGISLQDCEQCLVTNSLIENNGSPGILANNSVNCVISGNVIRSNGSHGIQLNGTASGNVVIGNIVREDASSQTNGINFGNSADDNVVAFNQLIDQTPNQIVDGSTGLQNVTRGNIIGTSLPAFASLDATPSVFEADVFITANAGATTITNFDNGYIGQSIKVLVQDGNTTIDFTGTNLKGNGGSDWSPATDDHMTCTFDGTDWYCDVSDNTA